MIKTHGTNKKTNNIDVAKDTLAIIKNRQYNAPSGLLVDLTEAIDFAVDHTVYYDQDVPVVSSVVRMPTIEVINETTTSAARRLWDQYVLNICALNFASATTPGGGWLHGAVAQEEDLCRCSSLYECLRNKPQFYNDNIKSESYLYTDGVIYSHDVPFFKDDYYNLTEDVLHISIITAPAPCLINAKDIDHEELKEVFLTRMIKVLQVARVNGHLNIILGAWGCGAFGNDPEMVAKNWKKALKAVPTFDRVVFAVYDTRPNTPVFETFKNILL